MIHRRGTALVAVLGILLMACGPTQQTAAPTQQAGATQAVGQAKSDQPSGTFKYAVAGLGAAAFDPAVSLWSAYIMQQFVFDPLVGIDAAGNYSPERSIAKSWTVSPDSLTYTFKIREGVRFSNGDQLTSEDVLYSFQRLREPWVTASEAINMMRNVDQLSAPDPQTFIIKVKTPSVSWFSLLSPRDSAAQAIVPKKYVETAGREAFNANPVGSGPYKVEKYQPGVSLALVPSGATHWAIGTPRWERIELLVVPEESTRKSMLLTGQVDAAQISRSSIKAVKDAGMAVSMMGDEIATFMFFFNHWQKELPTSDARVRKALSLAIDREAICKNLMEGACQRVNGWNAFPYTWDPAAVNFASASDWGYNPEQAKALLREAGYAGGFEIRIFSTGLPGLSEAPDINEAIAGMWRAVGVRAKIESIEYAAWVRSVWCTGAAERPTRNVAAAFMFPFQNRFWSMNHSAILFASKGSCTITKDATLDDLFAQGQKAVNEAEYVAAMTKFGEAVKAESRILQLFENGSVIAHNPKTIPTWFKAKISFQGGLRDFASTRSR